MHDTDVDHDATLLARFLLARGLGANSRIGVEADGSYEMTVASAAVRKLGGLEVALDPSGCEFARRDRARANRVALVLTADDALYDAPAVPAPLFSGLWREHE